MAYTTIDNPELYFQTKLYTGNGSTNAITFDGSENMQPDWVWIKSRSQAVNHYDYDSVRGTDKRLQQNITNAESTTDTTWFNSFNSDGFTIGSEANINNSSSTYASWNWKAGTTTGIAGSPSITPSAYSFNSTSGFSCISYTGNNTVGATIPHGLGVAPAVIIFKNRDSAVKWVVYHHKNTSAPETDHLVLNATDATLDDDSILNDTAPSSTLITMKTSSSVNSASTKYIAYCFAEKKGFSKFGSYTGNGNADGPFIYTGFKPAWFMAKRTDTTGNWSIYDNKRSDGHNPNTHILIADDSDAEFTSTSNDVTDFLSNGIKIRSSNNRCNASGGSYIYIAFAENPFVNSNGVPNNAR